MYPNLLTSQFQSLTLKTALPESAHMRRGVERRFADEPSVFLRFSSCSRGKQSQRSFLSGFRRSWPVQEASPKGHRVLCVQAVQQSGH